jgi:uncharacterized protein (TIGR02001 family)
VIARAEAARPAHGSRTSITARIAVCLLVGCTAAPAAAEIGATVSAFSDARLRGYSLSAGRPVGILDFAYDDASGFYADAAGMGVLRDGGDPAPLGLQLTGGYARRLKSGTTLDFGITHSSYSRYSSGASGRSYTEVYAGIARGAISSRIFLSPHYFASGHWTAYGEVNANVSPARKWNVNGHVGVLVPIRVPYGASYRTQADWSIGVSREIGRLSLHAAWSDGAPGRDSYYGRGHSRRAFVVGASWIL